MPRDESPALGQMQRLLWQIVVAPEGVEAALRERDDPEILTALIRSDPALSADRRVGVYANAYFERLLGVLETDYPALRATFGELPFRDLATSYLAVHPPTHFSLRYAGERLAEFLGGHAAADPFRQRFAFGADLARLEWAMVDAFDAADSQTASREQLTDVVPERWAELRFRLTPSLQLVGVRHAVQPLRRRFESGSLAEGDLEIEAQAATLCVWRDQERVFHRQLEPAEASATPPVATGSKPSHLSGCRSR